MVPEKKVMQFGLALDLAGPLMPQVRFGVGLDYFIELPWTVTDAKSENWSQQTRPEGSSAPMPSLVLYCHENLIVCVLYDDNEYVAGLQIAYPEGNFTNYFDWAAQGFVKWVPSDDGQVYWANQQYFVNEEFLAISAEERAAARDSDKMLQMDSIWVTGLDRELQEISRKKADIEASAYTEQACIPLMGRHYYYNMSSTLECNDRSMYPWFLLEASGDLVGSALMVFGQFPEQPTRDWNERPDRSAVELIVPRGPDCLYELADNPGVVTIHIYYIKYPALLTCIWQ